MTTNTKTLGTTCGRALGSAAAHTGHYVAVAFTATGRFGADVVSGSAAGYQETAALRSAQRLERAAARQAAQQPVMPIGITITA